MYKDNVPRLLDLMRTTFGKTFNEYYDGEPEQIPKQNLPCIVVTETSDSTDSGAFGQDDVTEQITIKVIFNKQDDYTGNVDPTNMTERKIREIIGKRDETTGHYLPTTVKGALREFGVAGITAIGQEVNVEIGIQPRAGGLLTQEGHVNFSIQYTVDIE